MQMPRKAGLPGPPSTNNFGISSTPSSPGAKHVLRLNPMCGCVVPDSPSLSSFKLHPSIFYDHSRLPRRLCHTAGPISIGGGIGGAWMRNPGNPMRVSGDGPETLFSEPANADEPFGIEQTNDFRQVRIAGGVDGRHFGGSEFVRR